MSDDNAAVDQGEFGTSGAQKVERTELSAALRLKWLLVLPAAILVLFLALLSAPWVVVALGLFVISDEAAGERALETAPLVLFWKHVGAW